MTNARVKQVLMDAVYKDGSKILICNEETWKKFATNVRKASNTYQKKHSGTSTYMGIRLSKPTSFPCVYQLREVTHNIHQFDDHTQLREWRIEGATLFDQYDVAWFVNCCPDVLKKLNNK